MTRVNSSKLLRLKTVGVTLPTELVSKARKYGINISQICRKALLEEIMKIEAKFVGGLPKEASNSPAWCGGWDLNPRTPTGQPPQGCAVGLAWRPPLLIKFSLKIEN